MDGAARPGLRPAPGRRRALARRVALAASLLIALGAGRAVAADEMQVFEVVLKDGRITPARLEVAARRKLKLLIRNDGAEPCELENLELRVEKVLAPGGRSFVVIHALPPGTHRFIDEFHPATGVLDIVAR